MEGLLSTPYTVDYLLERCFPDIHDVMQKVTYQVVTPGNSKSFWSLIARIELDWHDKELQRSCRLPSSLFVKLPTISDNVLTMDDDVCDITETLIELTQNELHFYRATKGMNVAGFPIPRSFYAEDIAKSKAGGTEGGCLVLEDFSQKARAVDYIPGFTIPQVEALLDALAAWHAAVIRDKSGLAARFVDGAAVSLSFQQSMYEESLRLEKIRPEWFAGRISRLERFYAVDYATKAQRSYREMGIPGVLVHMDLNTTNVLWEQDENGDATDKLAALIDFQQAHTGNLCEDIARILMLDIGVEERRTHTDRLLARYHARLETLLGGRQHTPVTLAQVQAAYRRIFPHVANFALFAAVCYVGMYERHAEAGADAKKEDLLKRAKGIVDDMTEMVGDGAEQ